MHEELKKPECPFCYVSCNDSDCTVVGCDGSKDICNKALYCGIYPHSQFCNPNGCKERLKEYFDKKIEDSAKRIVDGVIKTFLKNNTF
jgi:hypothetical protein